MKSIFAALLLVIATLVLSGCESDVPPSAADEAAGEKLKRGVTGSFHSVSEQQLIDGSIKLTIQVAGGAA